MASVVLCIDDRPSVLDVRKTTLQAQGYLVHVASAQAGLKLLEEVPVAAVLLEYKLDGMDAEAVAFYIKQRFPRLPIILLSAYSEMPEQIFWLVDEYVMKSAPFELLVATLEHVILENSERDPRRTAA